jgi:hypothetical protein
MEYEDLFVVPQETLPVSRGHHLLLYRVFPRRNTFRGKTPALKEFCFQAEKSLTASQKVRNIPFMVRYLTMNGK